MPPQQSLRLQPNSHTKAMLLGPDFTTDDTRPSTGQSYATATSGVESRAVRRSLIISAHQLVPDAEATIFPKRTSSLEPNLLFQLAPSQSTTEIESFRSTGSSLGIVFTNKNNEPASSHDSPFSSRSDNISPWWKSRTKINSVTNCGEAQPVRTSRTISVTSSLHEDAEPSRESHFLSSSLSSQETIINESTLSSPHKIHDALDVDENWPLRPDINQEGMNEQANASSFPSSESRHPQSADWPLANTQIRDTSTANLVATNRLPNNSSASTIFESTTNELETANHHFTYQRADSDALVRESNPGPTPKANSGVKVRARRSNLLLRLFRPASRGNHQPEMEQPSSRASRPRTARQPAVNNASGRAADHRRQGPRRYSIISVAGMEHISNSRDTAQDVAYRPDRNTAPSSHTTLSSEWLPILHLGPHFARSNAILKDLMLNQDKGAGCIPDIKHHDVATTGQGLSHSCSTIKRQRRLVVAKMRTGERFAEEIMAI